MRVAASHAYGWTDLKVPPYWPITQAEQAAHKAFEDEVIDRLYVLNVERAREEGCLGLGKKKPNPATAAGNSHCCDCSCESEAMS